MFALHGTVDKGGDGCVQVTQSGQSLTNSQAAGELVDVPGRRQRICIRWEVGACVWGMAGWLLGWISCCYWQDKPCFLKDEHLN